jgi:hypothetical protein
MNATEALKHEIAGAVFMHKLQAWVRDNHVAHPLKEGDVLPAYDLSLTHASGQSAEDFFKEHLPFLLTLLPATVAVVNRPALESLLGMCAPDAGGKADLEAGKILTKTIEGYAAITIRQQAYAAEQKRKGRL